MYYIGSWPYATLVNAIEAAEDALNQGEVNVKILTSAGVQDQPWKQKECPLPKCLQKKLDKNIKMMNEYITARGW